MQKISVVQYDKKFETLLLESCAVFAKNDPNAAFAVVTILMTHFDCSGYVALEFYYDTLMLMLQSMDNQTVGKLVNSNTFKDLIRRLITARSISVVCHGIAIIFQTRQKLEFQARLKFTRWYLSEHFLLPIFALEFISTTIFLSLFTPWCIHCSAKVFKPIDG